MPQIRKVERMTEVPAHCLCCGKGNVPNNEDHSIDPAIDLGADVNWGDSTYLCLDCATIVGSLAGMLSQDDVALLKVKLRKAKEKIHQLRATIETKTLTERQALRRARARDTLAS
jgi:hypothetical protein